MIGAAFANNANADVIALSATANNLLQITFTLPGQPAAHNALNIGVTSVTYVGFSGTASLFDGATLLSQNATSYVGQRYATAGSFFSATDPIIDFTTIADGSILGMFTLVVNSGSATFDSQNLFVQPFGDSGTVPGFAGVITSVTATPVPIPAAGWLLVSGVLGFRAIARKGQSFLK